MRGFALSPAAQTDLDEIWDYTAERWGQEQAARYITDIRDTPRAGRRDAAQPPERRAARLLEMPERIACPLLQNRG